MFVSLHQIYAMRPRQLQKNSSERAIYVMILAGGISPLQRHIHGNLGTKSPITVGVVRPQGGP